MTDNDAILNVVDGLTRNLNSDAVGGCETASTAGGAGESCVPLRCNDGERAVLSSYVALMRQCAQLAEKLHNK
ncbi:unnamed protein product [Arctia plantaginis]|uniref:Uncharacterized protein n=1 Tax=Arctia plantaginis TaxID=874455 RepID=A0A8S1BFD6_ARCPL|nr:unnamed protein product [Arctia plantaginis]